MLDFSVAPKGLKDSYFFHCPMVHSGFYYEQKVKIRLRLSTLQSSPAVSLFEHWHFRSPPTCQTLRFPGFAMNPVTGLESGVVQVG